MSALLLAGHGSHLMPGTAGMVWTLVDRLRAQGVAEEISACFWKEAPPLSQALESFQADEVVVVPALMASGYFTRRVIPAEMDLAGALSRRGGRLIHYTRPLGEHPLLAEALHNRVSETLAERQLDPREVAVAVIGHGTRRESHSRENTERGADALRARLPLAAVLTAYLDDQPAIASIFERSTAPAIIAVPWFLASGSHVGGDVPHALGLPPGANCGQIRGRALYYTRPVGDIESCCLAILEFARVCGLSCATRSPASPWSGFPRAGARALVTAARARGALRFGQLLLQTHEVRPLGESLNRQTFRSPAQLREHVRGGDRFRPLPTACNLPADWRVPLDDARDLPGVVETVYPGALADWAAARNGGLRPGSLECVSARQQGRYRGIHRLPASFIEQTVGTVCGRCVREPLWYRPQRAQLQCMTIPCREPCNLWLEQAHKERN